MCLLITNPIIIIIIIIIIINNNNDDYNTFLKIKQYFGIYYKLC